MKRSILATALCGALMSPAVGAIDFSHMSNADYWELRHTICGREETDKDKAGCEAMIRDQRMIWSRKRSKKEIISMAVELGRRYGCEDYMLPVYNLSRSMCWKVIEKNAPACEKEVFSSMTEITETAVNVEKVMVFQSCLEPPPACSDENIRKYRGFKKRCRDLELEARG